MLAAQGATPGALARLQPHARATIVRAARSGYVTAIAPVTLGERARDLVAAAGPGAGIVTAARVGDSIAAGDALATVYGGDDAGAAIERCFTIDDAPAPTRPLVYGAIDALSGTAADACVPGDSADVLSTLESR